jgi:hypothetical protein
VLRCISAAEISIFPSVSFCAMTHPLFGKMAPDLRSSFAGPAFSGYERVGTTFVASGPFGPST